MTIELSLYRARIGCYTQPKRIRAAPVPTLRFGRCLLAFAVLTVLLYIGGIEVNPGPYEINMDEIRKMNKEIMDELKNIRGEVRSVSAKCDNLETVCKHLEEKQSEMAVSMKKTEHELMRMDKCIAEQKNSVDMVVERVENIERVAQYLEDDLDRLEGQSRRDNLRFYGLPENENEFYESCATAMVDLLNKNFTNKQWSLQDITRAHRVGRQRDRQDPRPMIVKFARCSDTVMILKAKESRDNLRKQNVRISADHTKRQAEQLRDLRSQGKFGIVRGGRVVEMARREAGNARTGPTEETSQSRTSGRSSPTSAPSATDRALGGGRNSPHHPVETTPGLVHGGVTPARPYTRSRGSAWTARGGAGGGAGGSTRD